MSDALGRRDGRSRVEVWKDVSHLALQELTSAACTPLDALLVGSSARSPQCPLIKGSDIDAVIVVGNDLSTSDLAKLHDLLKSRLAEAGCPAAYHFKLFSSRELSFASHYDGFRVFEWQCSHVSLLGTRMVIGLVPHLGRTSFANSVLTQMVYELLGRRATWSSPEPWNGQVLRRLRRNLDIAAAEGYGYWTTESQAVSGLVAFDGLLRLFVERVAVSRVTKADLMYFLHRYYARIRHETVNKKSIYVGCASRYFRAVAAHEATSVQLSI